MDWNSFQGCSHMYIKLLYIILCKNTNVGKTVDLQSQCGNKILIYEI